jgi:2-haloacid dehalogenase
MIDLRAIEALSFDCYGTLIDWESGLLPILERWAAGSGITARGDELLAAFAEAETRLESERPSMIYPDILKQVLASMSERFGVQRDQAAEEELAQSIGDWPAFPDSAEALRSLKKRYQLAILSNVDRAGFSKSNQKLGVKFDLIVTAQDVGSYKPNVENFRTLLARLSDLEITKDRVLHVAQSLYHDHVPAKKFALSTVWINRRLGKRGSGATLAPDASVVPDAEYPSMQAFATAVENAFHPVGKV